MAAGPALLEHGRLNPGWLKLDLFCRGLRLDPACRLPGEGQALRVRAGLGSGLDLVLDAPGELWVNAPVTEPFAAESPYSLHGPDGRGRHELRHEGRPLVSVRVPARPAFYDLRTASGRPMGSVGSMQGTYLGVYYGELCANWKRPAEDACRFCALGCNVADGSECTAKSVEDVVETARAARAELGISFVHVNGGFCDRHDYLQRYGPLVDALRRRTGLLLGLQIPPLPDPAGYRELARLGVDNLSLCFEFFDPERFREACPGKDRRAGLAHYLESVRFCAREVGFPTVNGELIAGPEDPARTREAIDWLTGVGAVPTVCVFRPLAGTPWAWRRPPATSLVAPLFAHLYRRCMERGLPVGVAPGVRVSIVMTPEEGRWLLPPGQRDGWRWRRLRHAALRRALALRVAHRARRAVHA
jgi:hypothetical protein